MKKIFLSSALICLAASSLASGATASRVIDAKFHHLGKEVITEWPEAPAKPAGIQLDIRFEARANATEKTLGLTHRNVGNNWTMRLNGKTIGQLKRKKERREYFYQLPPNSLKQGENLLRISARRAREDITIGNATIYDGSIREVLNLQPVIVSVTDVDTGRFLPAKITIADETNGLVDVFYAATPKTAVRSGIVYTLGEATQFEVPPGEYQIYASRGTEWSMERRSLSVSQDSTQPLQFALRRELDTSGFIAADTHIHTLTFSGHGDATVEERMVTLAAEGVELAIATDHNHQTDFRPYQSKMHLNEFFTSVTGNEVTTKNGHFNSFPLPPGKDIPAYKEENWVKLIDGIRAKGARVVILNHPRWPDIARGPFGRFGLNRASGDRAKGGAFTFDALELINSGTLQPDPLYICRDWFALLNHGEKVTAVGASDSHAVGKIVGQGRTYVRSSTDDPAQINIDEACEAFLRGHTTVSMGIIANALVNGRHRHGDLVRLVDGRVNVDLRVQAPSWVSPRKAIVFVNGMAAAEKPVPSAKPGTATDLKISFTLPKQIEDGWLVCVVLGPGVKNPAWATEENYTFAATNPIYLDSDGDGHYSSPNVSATENLQAAGTDRHRRWQAVMSASDPIAIQMVAQWRRETSMPERVKLDARIRAAAGERKIFSEYLRYAPKN